MPITGWAFREKVKIEECRTHKFDVLIELAGLLDDLNGNLSAGGPFPLNWDVVLNWRVESRYAVTIDERAARELFAAITDQPDGVLPWITTFW